MHKTEAREGKGAVQVFLLGAPRTGKTQLAQGLSLALSEGDGGPHHARFAIHDSPPLPIAPAASAAKSLVLLMGLDLPASPAASREQQCADQALRNTLAQAGMAYQVVYGEGAERLESALRMLGARQPGAATGRELRAQPEVSLASWAWSCETCSDPQCERRLLSDLLAVRQVGDSPAPARSGL